MAERCNLIIVLVVLWLLFDTTAATAQWHTIGSEGPNYILPAVRAKSAHGGAPGATLRVRCEGELPGMAFFEFRAVVKDDPFYIQAECEEEMTFARTAPSLFRSS